MNARRVAAFAVAAAAVWLSARRQLPALAEEPRQDPPPVIGRCCAHCGAHQAPGDLAAVNDDWLCHPVMSDGPACYELVTVFGETLGARGRGRPLSLAPMPWELGYVGYADVMGQGLAGSVILPAVFGVLAEHSPIVSTSGRVHCTNTGGVSHATFPDVREWRRHAGPLLTTALTNPRAGVAS